MDLINITRKVNSGLYLLQKHDAKIKAETSVEMYAGTHSEILSITAETSCMVLLAL